MVTIMVNIPAKAPTEMIPPTLRRCTALKAKATGSATSNLVNGTMPVKTIATNTYKMVAMTKVPMMPRGSVCCGFLTSGAEADTASKPR